MLDGTSLQEKFCICLFMFYLELGQRLEHLMAMILIPKCSPKAAALVDYDQAALPLVFIPVIPVCETK